MIEDKNVWAYLLGVGGRVNVRSWVNSRFPRLVLHNLSTKSKLTIIRLYVVASKLQTKNLLINEWKKPKFHQLTSLFPFAKWASVITKSCLNSIEVFTVRAIEQCGTVAMFRTPNHRIVVCVHTRADFNVVEIALWGRRLIFPTNLPLEAIFHCAKFR